MTKLLQILFEILIIIYYCLRRNWSKVKQHHLNSSQVSQRDATPPAATVGVGDLTADTTPAEIRPELTTLPVSCKGWWPHRQHCTGGKSARTWDSTRTLKEEKDISVISSQATLEPTQSSTYLPPIIICVCYTGILYTSATHKKSNWGVSCLGFWVVKGFAFF